MDLNLDRREFGQALLVAFIAAQLGPAQVDHYATRRLGQRTDVVPDVKAIRDPRKRHTQILISAIVAGPGIDGSQRYELANLVEDPAPAGWTDTMVAHYEQLLASKGWRIVAP